MTKTLLLSPHSDDLAFSIGGRLLEGSLGTVLPLTIFSISNYSRRHPPAEVDRISRRRKTEDRRFFCRIPGALAPAWLNCLDAPLRHGAATEEEVDLLARQIAPWLAEGDRLAAPLALGGHPDHLLTHHAASRFFAGGTAGFFYEDLPYAAGCSLAEISAVAAEAGSACGLVLRPDLRASPAIAVAREWAVRCYRSQTGPESCRQLLDHPRRLGTGPMPAERIWLCRVEGN